jgi:DNA replication protein DnaC
MLLNDEEIEELNQAIRELRSLTQQSAWVGTHENIFVLGPAGVGKSFVACALAQKAGRDGYSAMDTRRWILGDGYSALYTRAQSLFRDLAMARADGSLRSLLSRLSRIDVLVGCPLKSVAPRSAC